MDSRSFNLTGLCAAAATAALAILAPAAAQATSLPCQDCSFVVDGAPRASVQLIDMDSLLGVAVASGQVKSITAKPALTGLVPSTATAYHAVYLEAEQVDDAGKLVARRAWDVTADFKAKVPIGATPLTPLVPATAADVSAKRLGAVTLEAAKWDGTGSARVSVYLVMFTVGADGKLTGTHVPLVPPPTL